MSKTLEELEVELAEARQRYREAQDAITPIYQEWEKAVTKKVETEIDYNSEWGPEVLDLLTDFGEVTAPYEAVKKYYAQFDKSVSYGGGVVWSEENFKGKRYPPPQVKLDKDQNIHGTLGALLKIAKFIDLDEIYVDVFEKTLSANGAFNIMFYPKTGNAKLLKYYYGSPSTLAEGSIEEVLKYTSIYHYYTVNGKADYEDDYDDDWDC